MQLLDIPQNIPQFGRSLANIVRNRGQVFSRREHQGRSVKSAQWAWSESSQACAADHGSPTVDLDSWGFPARDTRRQSHDCDCTSSRRGFGVCEGLPQCGDDACGVSRVGVPSGQSYASAASASGSSQASNASGGDREYEECVAECWKEYIKCLTPLPATFVKAFARAVATPAGWALACSAIHAACLAACAASHKVSTKCSDNKVMSPGNCSRYGGCPAGQFCVAPFYRSRWRDPRCPEERPCILVVNPDDYCMCSPNPEPPQLFPAICGPCA
jgi:hypothetical protein